MLSKSVAYWYLANNAGTGDVTWNLLEVIHKNSDDYFWHQVPADAVKGLKTGNFVVIFYNSVNFTQK